MRRLLRLAAAFAGFLPLASFAVTFFFCACITLINPLWGARDYLGRLQPRPILERSVAAAGLFLFSFVFFIAAAFVARWGLDETEPDDMN